MVEVPNKLLDRARIELDTYWRLDKQTASELISTLFESERQIAELRAELEANPRWKPKAEELAVKLVAAEAENARLRALPLKDEVERVLERAQQKMRTYVGVYPGDKELRGLLSDWDALLARLRAGEREGWRHGPYGYLIKPIGLNEEHWHLAIEPSAYPDEEVSVPLYTDQDQLPASPSVSDGGNRNG